MEQQTTRLARETRPEPAARWAAIARAVLERLVADCGPRDFAVRLWNGETIPPEGGVAPRFTLVLNRPGALRRMFGLRAALVVAEAFIRGDFDIEGDAVAATALGERLLGTLLRRPNEWLPLGRDLLRLPKEPIDTDAVREAAYLRGRQHSRARDAMAVRHHYDVGNDFYSLWLGQRMIYSCAYFETGAESIDAAQEAKLDLICRKLRLRAGETLLDIGCGWGGLVLFAAKRYGVNALGVTLSKQQAALANERIRAAGLQRHARVELLDYRELSGTGFDKIVSVGMAEHVGRARLPEYFAQAYRLLNPRGVFLNHAIATMGKPAPRAGLARLAGRETFITRYVFPDGELEPIHAMLETAEEAGFEVRNVESLREHYALTLRRWVEALEVRRDEALRVAGEHTYRVWRLYMAASAHGFDTARLNVYQALLVKPDAQGRSGQPLTRAAWYR